MAVRGSSWINTNCNSWICQEASREVRVFVALSSPVENLEYGSESSTGMCGLAVVYRCGLLWGMAS